jgi:hypothetical protein
MVACKQCLVGIITASIFVNSQAVAEETDEIEDLREAIELLKRELNIKQHASEEKIIELNNRIRELEQHKTQPEREVDKSSHSEESSEKSPVNLRLSGMAAMGGSTADDSELQNLQKGSHDPNRNGFTLQLLGLAFEGSLNPHLDARASIASRIDLEGESKIELEEAYVQTRHLDHGLELKTGLYFTEVGYLNSIHAHDWNFVDKPVVLSRIFGGDSLRNTGIRLGWETQASWATKLFFGVQHPKGETAVSFLWNPGENIGGHILIDREVNNLKDLLYSFRWTRDWETQSGTSIKSGASVLLGPNASGTETRTSIYGLDLSVQWRSDKTVTSIPIVSWNTEILYRLYEAGDTSDPTRETLRDWGVYTQVLWKFKHDLFAGLRLEYANGNGDNATDPSRDDRRRVSPNVTWAYGENVALRLQYNHDRAEHLEDNTADTLWLQLSYTLGGHDEHKH